MGIFDIPGVAQIANIGSTLIDRLVPDKNAAAKEKSAFNAAMLQIDATQFQAETDLAKGQQAINTEEAKSTNWFVAGWRPAVGWICVAGLFYQFIGYPVFQWANAVWKFASIAPPALDNTTLMTLLTGMLGLGGMRSFEKYNGVART